MRYKYPKTPHVPFSPHSFNRDQKLATLEHLKGKYVIVTEKMDGENTSMYRDAIHARSVDSLDHPSRSWVKSLWGMVRWSIPENWRVCGENMYAKHSIYYDNLLSYFLVFNVWDDNNMCLSWDETKDFCDMLGLTLVPELYRGTYEPETVHKLWEELSHVSEGYVVRPVEGFAYKAFGNSVAKYVRPSHVQTADHWMHGPLIQNRLANDS